MWNKEAKPTSAAIRRRVWAAQEAINSAHDLVKQRPDGTIDDLRALDQAYAWLTQVHRKFAKK